MSEMLDLKPIRDDVSLRLEEQGVLGTKRSMSWQELPKPDVTGIVTDRGEEFVLGVCGNPNEAQHLTYVGLPYSERMRSKAAQARLSVQQLALGPEHCVVGIQLYDPSPLPFQAGRLLSDERRATAKGEFWPLVWRLAMAIDEVPPRDDQTVSLHGFSLGADVAVEALYMALTNELFKLPPIASLGAFEPVRVEQRTAGQIVDAGRRSGETLLENIVASKSRAWNEIHGTDPALPPSRWRSVRDVIGMAGYVLSDMPGSWALAHGFAHDTTTKRLEAMDAMPGRVPTVAGRMLGSLMCTGAFADRLRSLDNMLLCEPEGDHASNDNLYNAAAYITATTVLVAAR